jgi:hypothetical protein
MSSGSAIGSVLRMALYTVYPVQSDSSVTSSTDPDMSERVRECESESVRNE